MLQCKDLGLGNCSLIRIRLVGRQERKVREGERERSWVSEEGRKAELPRRGKPGTVGSNACEIPNACSIDNLIQVGLNSD